MMALVFGVIAASIFDGSMHFVFGSQSTNTAVAPAIQIASAVAKNVFGCVMTSSPGPMPMRHQRQPDRVGAVAHADGVRRSVKRRELLLELLEHRPLHVLAALDHALDVRVYLRLNVLVLADVTIETNLHHLSQHAFLLERLKPLSVIAFGLQFKGRRQLFAAKLRQSRYRRGPGRWVGQRS